MKMRQVFCCCGIEHPFDDYQRAGAAVLRVQLLSQLDRETALRRHVGGFTRICPSGATNFAQLCQSLGKTCQKVVDWEGHDKGCTENGHDGSRVALCVAGGGSYYVIGRYHCVKTTDGTSAGDCDMTTHGSSCAAAHAEQEQEKARRGGDFCKRCDPNVFDNYKRTGQVEWIQGGPCEHQ